MRKTHQARRNSGIIRKTLYRSGLWGRGGLLGRVADTAASDRSPLGSGVFHRTVVNRILPVILQKRFAKQIPGGKEGSVGLIKNEKPSEEHLHSNKEYANYS